MKKIFSWGMMLAAAFTLTNCAKEMDAPVQEPETSGYPFEIVASTVDTKTVNDGMSTKWAAGDKINLFHAVGETTDYVDDGAFTVKDVETGVFTGTIAEQLDAEEEYDWYAIYPYNSKVTTPGAQTAGYTYIGYRNGINQSGYNSTASLDGSACPLYGILKNAGVQPVIKMQHLSAVVAINVTNDTEESLTITTASLTAPEDIVGSYYIDITKTPVAYTASGANYVSATATVNVSNGTALAKGESAILYAAIKPFTAAAGQKLSLSVNGYSKEITLSKAATFSAGKIKTVNFSYDKTSVVTNAISLPWYEDFSSQDLSNYVLTNSTTSTSETKLYTTDPLAGSEAPELLIAKGQGSFAAKIATGGYSGDLTLLFKSNYPERLAVTSSTSGVTITEVSKTEYTINVSASVDVFDIVFTNTTASNSRIDDISLVKGVLLTQTLTFATPTFAIELGSSAADSFVGQTVQGAKTDVVYSSNNEDVAEVNSSTGIVTLKGVPGAAVITAKAVATDTYKEATAEYLISVSNPVTGGAKQYTFTITKDDFNSTSYAANNKKHTSIAKAKDGSELEVDWESYQVMNQNSTMQWQKSKGYIYNITNLGVIDEVNIISTGGTFTKYINNTPQPSSNGDGGFFKINVGSATGKVTEITVTFTL